MVGYRVGRGAGAAVSGGAQRPHRSQSWYSYPWWVSRSGALLKARFKILQKPGW